VAGLVLCKGKGERSLMRELSNQRAKAFKNGEMEAFGAFPSRLVG
jgi:hypothetical protein